MIVENGVDVPQVFLSPTIAFEWALQSYQKQTGRSMLVRERQMVYTPHLLALGTVRILDRKRDVDHQETVARLVQPSEGPVKVDWGEGQAVISQSDLSPNPVGEGGYTPVVSTLAPSSVDLRNGGLGVVVLGVIAGLAAWLKPLSYIPALTEFFGTPTPAMDFAFKWMGAGLDIGLFAAVVVLVFAVPLYLVKGR